MRPSKEATRRRLTVPIGKRQYADNLPDSEADAVEPMSESEGSSTDGSCSSSSRSSDSDDHQECAQEVTGCCDESRYKYELRFKTVLREEREAIEANRLGRMSYERPGTPFSVAFSGGGVRAASFQAGVLWRLATTNTLKDVEYLCAVSGGAYIASGFASHCLAAKEPEPGESLEAWYLNRVADTIVRMQTNISYLVRDAVVAPGTEKATEGSGLLPRALDLPMLLLVLMLTLLTFPITFTFMYLIPFAEVADLFFGAAARMAFCAQGVSPWQVFLGSWHLYALIVLTGVLILVNFVIWVLWKVLPPCQRERAKLGRRPPRNLGWLLGHSTLAAMTRLSFMIIICLAVIMVLTDMEIWQYDFGIESRSRRTMHCRNYIHEMRQTHHWRCSDLEDGAPWWNHSLFWDAAGRNSTQPVADTLSYGFVREAIQYLRKNLSRFSTSMWSITTGMLIVLLVVSIILLPLVDFLFAYVLFAVGPAILFMMAVGFVRWRVFSPITQQPMPPLIKAPFNEDHWKVLVTWTFVIDMLLVPFYHVLRSNMHRYYTRSLQKAYFARGEDKSWKQFKDNVLAPFLLLTGTVNDFVRADEERSIHEISFSSIHTGSETLGYIRARRPQSLAKCTALTGAATDAFILGMLDRIRYRFWLEVLNLCMGDFIPFRRRERPVVQTLKQKLGCSVGMTAKLVYQLPSTVLIAAIYGLLLRAVVDNDHVAERMASCSSMRFAANAALAIGSLSFFFSFFGFLPWCKFLLHQPGIRQMHQMMRYYHRASRPPNLIYVTDGGVQDCTGILQLLRRKRTRILLVLAAADPNDELAVLRTTMEAAASERLASFYDPQDPRRDVRATLDEYQQQQDRSYLHLGIQYGWCEGQPQETGHLYIVKNRLLPSMLDNPVRPLLTEEEIRSGTPCDGQHADSPDMLQTELGACCFDSCHTNGVNFGSRFPHVSNANQFMTPQMFNSLCRLGFAISDEAIQAISRPGQLGDPWEKFVHSPNQEDIGAWEAGRPSEMRSV